MTRLGNFGIDWEEILLQKQYKCLDNFGQLWKTSLFKSNWCGNFCRNFGYFLFQHLATLPTNPNQSNWRPLLYSDTSHHGECFQPHPILIPSIPLIPRPYIVTRTRCFSFLKMMNLSILRRKLKIPKSNYVYVYVLVLRPVPRVIKQIVSH